MSHQSESQLEKTLINQLQQLGFSYVVLKDQDAIITNLQTQLEKFNQTKFSDAEFAQIFNMAIGKMKGYHL